MRRAVLFSVLLILFDQLLKFSFQLFFPSGELRIFDFIRFRYVINPGIYVKQNMTTLVIVVLQITQIAAALIVFQLFRNLKLKYSSGILLDLSFGFFTTAFLGNLVLDRILIGGIRDYLITPLGIANFADVCGIIGLIFLLLEFLLIKIRSYN